MQNKKPTPLTINQHIMDIVRKESPETMKQLIKLVRLRHPIHEQEIVEQILHPQKQGKLALREYTTPLPRTVEGYLLTKQAAWYWTIIILALATTTLVFTIPENAYHIIYARHVLGSIFILWLPGYTFIKALFPAKELDNIERAALSIGMSLALVPITSSTTPHGA